VYSAELTGACGHREAGISDESQDEGRRRVLEPARAPRTTKLATDHVGWWKQSGLSAPLLRWLGGLASHEQRSSTRRPSRSYGCRTHRFVSL
jgi:hypothetical protein